MDVWIALWVTAALIVATLLVGVLWRARQGRIRSGTTDEAEAVAVLGIELAPALTLLQFSTVYCALCPGTRRLLTQLAAARPGVEHREFDLTERPDVVRRLGITSTPTVWLLDARGVVRARFAGAPRLPELTETIDTLALIPHETAPTGRNS